MLVLYLQNLVLFVGQNTLNINHSLPAHKNIIISFPLRWCETKNVLKIYTLLRKVSLNYWTKITLEKILHPLKEQKKNSRLKHILKLYQ